jgi:hypothetical protein
VLRLLSGCRHAHAESAVGSVAVRWLQRADLGTEKIACRTAQNLYSLHRSRRFAGKLEFGILKILRNANFMRRRRGIQMKRTHHFVAIGVLVFLIMTGQAFADCVLNGKRLPEGTRIGSLVCEYGQWVEKPEKP